MIQRIDGVDVPPNEGNLPLELERDEYGKVIRIRVAWKGATIREQFPWTRPKDAA